MYKTRLIRERWNVPKSYYYVKIAAAIYICS